MLHLDNADLGIAAGQLPGQVHGDAAAPQNGYVLHSLQGAADAPEHFLQLCLGAHHIELVPAAGHEGAVGDDKIVPPVGGADQHLCQAIAVEIVEGHPGQGVLLRYLKTDHIDAASGKGLHGKGRREAQDPGDLLGRPQIGVDEHVQADLPLEHGVIPAILGVAYPGDGVLGPQLFGDEAAHQVCLVQIGDGDDQVRAADPRRVQHADAGAVALHAHDVQGAVGPVQGCGVVIHDGDVVILHRQLPGNGIADLAVAYDDDFHACSSPLPDGSRLRLRRRITALYSAPMISTVPLIYSHSSTTTIVAMEPYSTE